MLSFQKVYVGPAGRKGRGVFARKKIESTEIIETSPYIAIPPRDDKKLTDTIINSYWFDLEKRWGAIGLGLTSLYNHSQDPNAAFSVNKRNRTITIKAIRTITRGEEITIDYGYELDV